MIKFYAFLILLVFAFGYQNADAQISMSAENWKSNDTATKFENFLGQQSLFLKAGTALVKNSKFEDGVIEVDIAPSEQKGFAGLVFRTQSSEDLEVVYLRLFKSGFGDAVQYTPRFHDIDCWQLYTTGYTATANFKESSWTHLKVEIEGRTARIFINHAAEPSLVIKDLKRDEGKGEVGVYASDGTYFSKFIYTSRSLAAELAKPANEFQTGTITQWDVSQIFSFESINFESYPNAQQLSAMKWEKLNAETPGFVNLSRYRKKERVDNITFNHSNEVVYTRKKIVSTKAQMKKLFFGYSDQAAIFLNGKIVFSGNSSFRTRDNQFLGAIGLNDAVYLDLKNGENELLFVVSDKTGGWGVQAQFADTEGLNF